MPVFSAISPPQCEFANIKEVQNKDQSIAQLVAYLQTGEIAGNFSDDRKLVSKANQYVCKMAFCTTCTVLQCPIIGRRRVANVYLCKAL